MDSCSKELLTSSFHWQSVQRRSATQHRHRGGNEPLPNRLWAKGKFWQREATLLIAALGHQYLDAIAYGTLLAQKGISAMIVDPIFHQAARHRPLWQILLSHSRIVTLEEHSLKGGLGSEINEFLFAHEFGQAQVLNFGIPEAYIEQGSYKELLNEIHLTPEKMVVRILAHFSFKKELTRAT